MPLNSFPSCWPYWRNIPFLALFFNGWIADLKKIIFKSACLNIGKSLKLCKQIYETLKFEICDRPGLATRQNNFLVVGGAQKKYFFKSSCLNIGKSLKLCQQIYETLQFEVFDRPGLATRQNNFLFVGEAQKKIFLSQHAWIGKSLFWASNISYSVPSSICAEISCYGFYPNNTFIWAKMTSTG